MVQERVLQRKVLQQDLFFLTSFFLFTGLRRFFIYNILIASIHMQDHALYYYLHV